MLHDLSYTNVVMLLATIPDEGIDTEDEQEEIVSEEEVATKDLKDLFAI